MRLRNQKTMTAGMLALLAGVVLLHGCASAPPADTRAGDEAAIRKIDAEWVKAAQTKQVDAWMAFYADDAVVLAPNEKVAASRESIRKAVGDLLALPGLAITWQPSKVEVARSGDLAYIYGTYDVSWDESNGKRTTDVGKNVEIWRKQADGSWKCIVDTWNTDLPPAPPAR